MNYKKYLNILTGLLEEIEPMELPDGETIREHQLLLEAIHDEKLTPMEKVMIIHFIERKTHSEEIYELMEHARTQVLDSN